MRLPVISQVNDSIRYGFAVGKVRVLETRILVRSTYERLIDAPAFDEQRRILSDTYYGRYLEGITTADGVERVLTRALDDCYDFVDEAELPPPVARFFRVRYDYVNLKAALKAEALGVPTTGMLEDLGTIPAEEFTRRLDALPEPLCDLVEQVRESEEQSTPASIDAQVDHAMFAELTRLAKESHSVFLTGLVSLMIDIANAKTLLRARLAGLGAATVSDLVLAGGTIKRKELLELYALPPLEAATRFAAIPALSGVRADEIADVKRLDVIADNVVVRYLRAARAVPIGAEPVIAYVLAREAEIVALRMVLIGKLSNIDPGVLRERLRDLYV